VNQLFPLQFPGRFSNSSLLESSQSSGWVSSGLLIPLSAMISHFMGRTGPPSLSPLGAVPRCLTTLAPATSCAKSPARLPLRHPAQSLELNFLFTVPALDHWPVSFSSVETLRRASGLHASPVFVASPHPWFEVRLRTRQRPRFSRSSVRLVTHAINCLTSWLCVRFLITVYPGCRSALADRFFSSQLLAPYFGPSLFPQLRLCGVLWSARYP